MIEKMIDMLTRHVVVRFVLSGGTSAVVNLVLLYVLNITFGIHYLFASVLAFLGAFSVSFTLHKFWTFKSHSENTRDQVILYLGTSLFALLLNTLLMYIFVDHVHLHVLLAQIIAGLMVAVFSFFVSHRFVFKYKKEKNIQINIE